MSGESLPAIVDAELPPIRVDHPLFKASLVLSKWQRRRIIEHRREVVSEYLVKGWTELRIANHLGVSSGTIHGDVVAIRDAWREATLKNAEEAASLDLARLEWAINGLMPRVVLGDEDAITAMIRCIQQKGRILGYGSGMQVDVEAFLRSVAEANGLDPERAIEVAMKIRVTM